MEVDQPLPRFPELREPRGVAIYEAARAARPIERAAQHPAPRIAGEVALAEPGFHRLGCLEFAGELGALSAFAHERGIGPAADQQLDRVDQNRFARAGLAGERAEAGLELERG